MRANRTIDRSRVWLQIAGAVGWLSGAVSSAAWMLHGGGIFRPLASFAVWIAFLGFVMIRALTNKSDVSSTTSEILEALRYSGYSVVVLALSTLFLEYWPVTITMAFMFAICRSIRTEDTAVYS